MAGNGSFPAELDVVPATPTDADTGEQQQNLLDWLSATFQLPGAQPLQDVTISGGNITPNRALLLVDTEGAAASDDLDHILQTNLPDEGRIVFVRAKNAARVVTVRHNQGGAGNLLLLDGANFILNDTKKISVLAREGTAWTELFRFYGADAAAWRTFLGLGTLSTLNRGTTPAQSPIQVPAIDDILGLASVDIWADAIRSQSANGCSLPQQVQITADQPEIVSVDFPGSVDRHGIFSWKPPKKWNKGTVQARFHFTVGAAVGTTVKFGLQGVCIADNEALAQAYGTRQTTTKTYGGTADRLAISALTPAITLAGASAGVVEEVCFRVTREGSADTTTQDVRLRRVEILYTVSALNDT